MKKKNSKIKKVLRHIKGDMKMFKKEREEDKELAHELRESSNKERREEKKEKHKSSSKSSAHSKKSSKRRDPKNKVGSKFEKVMKEFKNKTLHSGSKKGPLVTNPKQALAISFSEQRRAKKKRK